MASLTTVLRVNQVNHISFLLTQFVCPGFISVQNENHFQFVIFEKWVGDNLEACYHDY